MALLGPGTTQAAVYPAGKAKGEVYVQPTLPSTAHVDHGYTTHEDHTYSHGRANHPQNVTTPLYGGVQEKTTPAPALPVPLTQPYHPLHYGTCIMTTPTPSGPLIASSAELHLPPL